MKSEYYGKLIIFTVAILNVQTTWRGPVCARSLPVGKWRGFCPARREVSSAISESSGRYLCDAAPEPTHGDDHGPARVRGVQQREEL